MESLSNTSKVILNLTSLQSKITKRFDNRLSLHGISLNEFMLLLHLSKAPDQKMRRIDLAEKIGLSASGVTRMLLPMEKIGLVEKEANVRDARVSLVKLSSGGQRIFAEAMATMQQSSENDLSRLSTKKVDDFLKILIQLGGEIE